MKITTPAMYIAFLLFRPFWWIQKVLPRKKNIWIFGAWMGTQYADNARYLFEYILKNRKEITPYWITRSPKIFSELKAKHIPVVKVWSLKGIILSLRAKYTFITVGMSDINPYFHNGCKLVWLWHGMPLKKIGIKVFEPGHERSKLKQFLIDILNPYWKFSCYKFISTSPFFSKILKDSWELKNEQILEAGQPRCDLFYTELKDSFIADIRQKYKDAKIILYMPTYRSQDVLFNPFIEKYGFDESEFSSFLEMNNLVFIYKPHFFDRNVDFSVSSNRFIYLRYDKVSNLYALLNSVDALATDYSSVYFDFLCTKKSTYFLTFDYDEYKEKSRDVYFDMHEYFHGVFCNNWSEFYQKTYDNLKLEVEKDFEFFSCFCDGKSSEKVTDYLLDN